MIAQIAVQEADFRLYGLLIDFLSVCLTFISHDFLLGWKFSQSPHGLIDDCGNQIKAI